MTRRFAIIFVLLASVIQVVAQETAKDSLTVVPGDTLISDSPDTVLLKSYATRYNPRKALLYAAVVPGLGQVYNKKYWKLPLVYGGFFGIGYAINFYNQSYQKYKTELFYNLDHGLEGDDDINTADGTSGFTTGGLRQVVDKSRRERDFWVIMMGAMYILQMVDAHVDAHLKEFDLNPNLRVSIEPSMDQSALMGRQTSVSLIIKF